MFLSSPLLYSQHLASDNAPGAVYSALNAAHAVAGMPLRNAAYDGQGGFATSTRDTGAPIALHVTKATSEGSLSTAWTQDAHKIGKHQVENMS
jgi:hypothetical protein